MSAETTDFVNEGRAAIYEKVLNNEGFLNDLWNTFDASSKIGILEEAGYDVVEEYIKNSDIDLHE